MGTSHHDRIGLVALGGLFAATAALVIPTWGLTYWDFGDGNYLYVGRRILDGLVPYRDILAPQPPLHLLLAALSQWVGGLFGSELVGARLYNLAVRLAAAGLVYACARHLFGCALRAVVAAGVYLFLPIGFWWSLCLQSENVELVFLLLAFYAVLRLDTRWIWAGGVASALAMHCNMTAVPYFLVNLLFLLFRRRDLAWRYAVSGVAVWSGGAALAFAWAGSYYLDNVVLNQVGSFPRADILGYSPFIYFWDKIIGEGTKIFDLEGPLIIAALVSMALLLRERGLSRDRGTDAYLRTEYAVWYGIGMLLSLGFVMKGGTVNYIFVLGEPAVALFGADAIVRFARAAAPAGRELKQATLFNTTPALRVLVPLAAIALLVLHPNALSNLRMTLAHQQSELPPGGVEELAALVEWYSEPGDPILAPPFYAYITGRTVAGELAENYLWQIKYINEVFDREEGEAHYKMREVAAMIRRREIPILLLDMNQTGRIPIIAQAAEAHYQPIMEGTYNTRNVPLMIMVPRNRNVDHPGTRGAE